MSLLSIRKVIISIIGEPREISQNQREFFSNYTHPNGNFIAESENINSRIYSRVVILGERRPYDIQVQVLIETKSNGTFETTGIDKQRTKGLVNELNLKLNQSRINGNNIDEFRAF